MGTMHILKAAIANEPGTFTTAYLGEITGIPADKVHSLSHTLITNRVIFRWGKKGSTPFYRNVPIPAMVRYPTSGELNV